MAKKRVVIEVEGGVASCVESPDDVEVIIRDWDAINEGDLDPLKEEACAECGRLFDNPDKKFTLCESCQDETDYMKLP